MPEEPDSWIRRIFGGIRRSVLFFLTMLVLAAVILELKVPDQVWNIIMMVYAFYFGSKGTEYVKDIKELAEKTRRLEEEKEKIKKEKEECEEKNNIKVVEVK